VIMFCSSSYYGNDNQDAGRFDCSAH